MRNFVALALFAVYVIAAEEAVEVASTDDKDFVLAEDIEEIKTAIKDKKEEWKAEGEEAWEDDKA